MTCPQPLHGKWLHAVSLIQAEHKPQASIDGLFWQRQQQIHTVDGGSSQEVGRQPPLQRQPPRSLEGTCVSAVVRKLGRHGPWTEA